MRKTTPQSPTSTGTLRHLAAAGGCGCHPTPVVGEPAVPPAASVLRLSPTVVAKLLYFREVRGQEAVAVGVPLPAEPLVIVDARLRPSPSTLTAPSDNGASDAAAEAHVWMLTHAGDDPTPTPSDEDVFGILRRSIPWAVLCVLTSAGRHLARLEFHIGPGGCLRLPVCVDLRRPFAAADHAAWDREFAALAGASPQVPRRRPAPRASQSSNSRKGSHTAASLRGPDA